MNLTFHKWSMHQIDLCNLKLYKIFGNEILVIQSLWSTPLTKTKRKMVEESVYVHIFGLRACGGKRIHEYEAWMLQTPHN